MDFKQRFKGRAGFINKQGNITENMSSEAINI